jgi:hypothetical protein
MKLNKINLKNVIAVGHEPDRLALLIDRGNAIEYLEIPAPRAAYEGLQQVADYINEVSLSGQIEPPQFPLRPQPIPLFVNVFGVFNRVENPPNSQACLEEECPEAIMDEVPKTWEMLGHVNLTRE